MWAWKRFLHMSWTDPRTNESIFIEVHKHKEIFEIVKSRRWNMIGHILRYDKELLYRIIGGKLMKERTRMT